MGSQCGGKLAESLLPSYQVPVKYHQMNVKMNVIIKVKTSMHLAHRPLLYRILTKLQHAWFHHLKYSVRYHHEKVIIPNLEPNRAQKVTLFAELNSLYGKHISN